MSLMLFFFLAVGIFGITKLTVLLHLSRSTWDRVKVVEGFTLLANATSLHIWCQGHAACKGGQKGGEFHA